MLLAVVTTIPAAYGYVNVEREYFFRLPRELESVRGEEMMENMPIPDASLVITADEITDVEILKFENRISNAFREGVREVALVVALSDFILHDNQVLPLETVPPQARMLFAPDLKTTVINIYLEPLKVGISLEEKMRETHLRVKSIKNVQDRFEGEIPEGAEMYLTGGDVILDDFKTIIDKDQGLIWAVSLTGVAIVLFCLLVSIWVPIALALSIGLAILWNLGACFWWPGSLNFIIILAAASLQLGVTVEYGFILSTRYREERKRREKEQAMSVALAKSARSILGASITTMIAFAALGVANIDVISTFGLTIARGVGLSLLAATLIFPSILLLSERLTRKLSWKGFRE